LKYSKIASPVGDVLIVWNSTGLTQISFQQGCKVIHASPTWEQCTEPDFGAGVQLTAYFKGTLTDFDLPLAPEGTDFQRQVWKELASVPFGETMSYSELAARLGKPTSSRAIGAANARNPLPVVVPCHRIVGINGNLTGYSAGLAIKKFLLKHECHQDFTMNSP
tara:strand:+ start:378 stop:869 length:492 start_codon:yes stop_codon:yes gene_type:complete